MKTLSLAIILALFVSIPISALSTDEWMRVQADDGSFSIEVPSEHKYFFSKHGFVVSKDQRDYLTSNMSMLTAYNKGTLLSVEVYDAVPAALAAILNKDKNDLWKEGPEERIGKVKVKTIKREDSEVFAFSKYFQASGKIFVLLAASRDGDNELIRRFFDSVDLRTKDGTIRNGTSFSKLKVSDITVKETVPAAPAKPNPDNSAAKPPADPGVRKFLLLRRFASSYVPEARGKNVSGEIRFRVYFAKDGFIPHIDIYKKLGGGLLRQTLFAAARIRYLPEEKDGIPVTISRPVQYTFRIY